MLIVVYIFLQSFRATIIPMCTVPVSLLGAFILFPVLGFSVNVLTMFGLVLAIGIVVDDAIVVVEAVQHHLEHGLTPVDATRQAMKEVSGPVVAIGLVLCAVFVPVAFMGGVTGQLYKPVRPHHRRRGGLLRHQRADAQPRVVRDAAQKTDARPRPDRGILQAGLTRLFDWLSNGYGSIVGGIARKAARSMLLLVAVVGGIWLVGKFVPGGFIPDEDKGYLFVAVQLPEGASLQRTDEVLKQVENIVGGTPGVRSAVGLAGMNILNSLNFPNAAVMFVGLEAVGGTQGARVACQRHRAGVDEKICSHSRRARLCLRPAAVAGLRQRLRLHHAVAGPLRRHHRATGRLRETTYRGRRQAPGNRPHQHHLQSRPRRR